MQRPPFFLFIYLFFFSESPRTSVSANTKKETTTMPYRLARTNTRPARGREWREEDDVLGTARRVLGRTVPRGLCRQLRGAPSI
ncbi:hypothetical protein IWZ03DRAFT_101687 [Phyllosticta citriasiana]|uniref:Secreted protein n=1 Tax=Phyllosticta citriasiana TaxID=595635 RepID=A0ABR1KYT0_9PEZI